MGKFVLDQKLYPCRGPNDNFGLLSYLGDLCKRRQPQWVEQITVVSSLLWPARTDKARGLVLRQVSTCDACKLDFFVYSPARATQASTALSQCVRRVSCCSLSCAIMLAAKFCAAPHWPAFRSHHVCGSEAGICPVQLVAALCLLH